ncbi:MAG: hypothetical protein QM722_20355 [Piscinibacter sp.]
MSHEHAHSHAHPHVHAHGEAHEHAHGHVHQPARSASEDAVSVLMQGAAARIGAAAVAIALLWACVAWALSDLAS